MATAFDQTMQRVIGLLNAHSELHGKQGRPKQHVSDVLRGALVLTTAALDARVLDLVGAALPDAIRSGRAGSSVSKWMKEVPDEVLVCLTASDPALAVANSYRSAKLAQITFQRSAAIDGVLLTTLSCASPFPVAALAMGTTEAALREELDDLVKRRNAIAHAGDISESGRARSIRITLVQRAVVLVKAVAEATLVVTTAPMVAPGV